MKMLVTIDENRHMHRVLEGSGGEMCYAIASVVNTMAKQSGKQPIEILAIISEASDSLLKEDIER